MGRSPCCSKEGLNRGAWTAHEDKVLTDYIRVHGEGRWRNLPKKAGLKRCGKSCRLRWLNYLRPDIKRGNISSDEEELIIRLHKLLGNRWSLIAGRLPGRTDNEIKNYWNTNLGKKVKDGHQTNNNTSSSRETTPPNGKTKSQTQLDSSHVVRTKASKCSKMLFINPHPYSSSQFQNNKAQKLLEKSQPLMSVTHDVHSDDQIMKASVYDNAFLSDQDEGIATDLLIDFNVGDICLSDLLNSDFSNMCDFSYHNNNHSELLSPCSDQTPMFSDEILKDWTQTNFAEEDKNVSKILGCSSITSLIEPGEELEREKKCCKK